MKSCNNQGFILISTLVLLLLISIVAMTTYYSVINTTQSGVTVKESDHVRYQAEVGIDRVEELINETTKSEVPDILWNKKETCQQISGGCPEVHISNLQDAIKELNEGGKPDKIPLSGFKSKVELTALDLGSAKNTGVSVYYLALNYQHYDKDRYPTAYIYKIYTFAYSHFNGEYQLLESGYLYDLEWDKIWNTDRDEEGKK